MTKLLVTKQDNTLFGIPLTGGGGGVYQEYDLTPQLDGAKTVFDLDPAITEEANIAVYYAGQRLVNEVNYTIDFGTNTLTMLFDDPPDDDEGRHLIVLTFTQGLSNGTASVGDVDVIDDAVTTLTKTWSSQKINDEFESKQDIIPNNSIAEEVVLVQLGNASGGAMYRRYRQEFAAGMILAGGTSFQGCVNNTMGSGANCRTMVARVPHYAALSISGLPVGFAEPGIAIVTKSTASPSARAYSAVVIDDTGKMWFGKTSDVLGTPFSWVPMGGGDSWTYTPLS